MNKFQWLLLGVLLGLFVLICSSGCASTSHFNEWAIGDIIELTNGEYGIVVDQTHFGFDKMYTISTSDGIKYIKFSDTGDYPRTFLRFNYDYGTPEEIELGISRPC